MSNNPRPAADDFETSLQGIMERLRKQAEEIAQLRRDLDQVRTSTSIVTPVQGVDVAKKEPRDPKR